MSAETVPPPPGTDDRDLQFLADMGVAWRVVEWLRATGYEAIHLREQGLDRLPDTNIFQKSMVEGRIVLTFDLDFGEIAAHTRGRRIGVIVFRLHNTRTPHVIDRLRRALEVCSEDLKRGAVVVVEESRLRVRHFER